jgi:hypothetical protein
VNFYRKFIDHYSEKARLLHDLTKKDTPWAWKKEQQDAFETMKKSFVEKVILKTPEQGKQYFMATDMSLTGTGGVLMQKDNNGDLRPLSFISLTFTPPERNYKIYDQELLAMVKGLEEWRHYLEGVSHLVVAWVDHDNLTYFRNPQHLNRRQACWQMYLSRFDLQILHQSAKKKKLPYSIMLIPNTSSQRSKVDTEDDNKDQTLLPTSMFVNELIIEEDLRKELAQATSDPKVMDEYFVTIWKMLKKGTSVKYPDYRIIPRLDILDDKRHKLPSAGIIGGQTCILRDVGARDTRSICT